MLPNKLLKEIYHRYLLLVGSLIIRWVDNVFSIIKSTHPETSINLIIDFIVVLERLEPTYY